jgi:hypothetical protein
LPYLAAQPDSALDLAAAYDFVRQGARRDEIHNRLQNCADCLESDECPGFQLALRRVSLRMSFVIR